MLVYDKYKHSHVIGRPSCTFAQKPSAFYYFPKLGIGYIKVSISKININHEQSSMSFYKIAYDTNTKHRSPDYNNDTYEAYFDYLPTLMSWADIVEEEYDYEIPVPPWSFEMAPVNSNKHNNTKKHNNTNSRRQDRRQGQQQQQRQQGGDESDAESVFNDGTSGSADARSRSKKNSNPKKQTDGTDRSQRNAARELSRQRREAEERERLRALLNRSSTPNPATTSTVNVDPTSETDPGLLGDNVPPATDNEAQSEGFETDNQAVSGSVEMEDGRTPIVFPARLVLNQAREGQEQGARSQSTSAIDYVTEQGKEREAAFRRRMALIEKNNPVSAPQNKQNKKKAPDNLTYEVTNLDFTALGDDFLEAAELVSLARTEYDMNQEEGEHLRFDSKLLRSGDWMIWTENEYTRDWFKGFFATAPFCNRFRGTLISDRGNLIRYAFKVQHPDSIKDNQLIVDHVTRRLGKFGYLRISDEIRWYEDQTVQKAYTSAKKNRKKYTPPERARYDKMFFRQGLPTCASYHARQLEQTYSALWYRSC